MDGRSRKLHTITEEDLSSIIQLCILEGSEFALKNKAVTGDEYRKKLSAIVNKNLAFYQKFIKDAEALRDANWNKENPY